MPVAVLIVALALVFYQLGRTYYYIRIGIGLVAEARPFSRGLANPTLRFLVVGDSSAVGVGAERPEQSVAGRLGADFPEAAVTNRGVSGARTHDLISVLEDAAGEHYDLVLIQIGGNDIVRLANVEKLGEDMAKILDLANGISEHVILLTSGNVGTAKLFPPGVRWFHEEHTRKVRRRFMDMAAEKGATYIDLFRERNDDPFARDPGRYYAADNFHPSGEGYADWYLHVAPVAVQLFMK